jgi:negative regulator of flagellin synthesis FlgM
VEIKGVSNSPLFVNNTKKNKSEAVQNQDAKDKIEISSEGRDLARAEFSTNRLEEIRKRISTNFYDSDEVLNKVAEKVLVELKK